MPMMSPPRSVARTPKLCQAIRLPSGLLLDPDRRSRRAAPSGAQQLAAALRRALAAFVAVCAALVRRPFAMRRAGLRRRESELRRAVRRELCAARSRRECERFEVGRVLALEHLEGDVYLVQVPLHSVRSNGKHERRFIVRIRARRLRALLGLRPRVSLPGRHLHADLATYGRMAAKESFIAGKITLEEWGLR